MKEHLFKTIRQILKENNIPSTKRTILNWEKEGRIKFRRRPVTDWRVANDKEIKEIVKAFSPGGSGRWISKK